MWFTVLHLTRDDLDAPADDDQVIVAAWGCGDGRPFTVGGDLRRLPDIVATLRCAAGPGGTLPPRCQGCGEQLDVPELDALAEAA